MVGTQGGEGGWKVVQSIDGKHGDADFATQLVVHGPEAAAAAAASPGSFGEMQNVHS